MNNRKLTKFAQEQQQAFMRIKDLWERGLPDIEIEMKLMQEYGMGERAVRNRLAKLNDWAQYQDKKEMIKSDETL